MRQGGERDWTAGRERSRGGAIRATLAVLTVLALPVRGSTQSDTSPGTVPVDEARDGQPEGSARAPVRAGVTVEYRALLGDHEAMWNVLHDQYRPLPGLQALPETPTIRSEPARLTVREAVGSALENNPGLAAQSLSPLGVESGILKAQSQFDPVFGGDANFGRRRVPAGSLLQGAVDVETGTRNLNLSLSKILLSGAKAGLTWTNSRLTSDSAFQSLSPQYTPEAIVSLNQPLLRDFGLYFTTLRIRIAENATDEAIAVYQGQAASFIEQVVRAYWQVVLLQEQVKVLQDSLELARQTTRDNRTRVDVGVLPPVAVKESEAEAARREEDVIVAENALEVARMTLQQVVYMPRADQPYFARRIDPVERPISSRVHADLQQAIAVAMERRPEIQAARLTVRGRDLNAELAKNQLLPRLDVYGLAGLNGLAGTSRPVTALATPAPGATPVPVFDSPYTGGWNDALNRMVGTDFYSYQAGVKLEVPIGNAAAEAEYDRSRVEKTQAEYAFRERVSTVSLEVGKAVADVMSGLQRIEATRVARELSEENLRNQMKRYEVGVVTTTDLLKFQNEVARARLQENNALIDYNNAITALDRAQGVLLPRFNVQISSRPDTHTPWWAKF